MKKFHNLISLIIAGAVIILDQLCKFLINHYMLLGQSVPLFDSVLNLTLIYNRGAGFGILQNQRIFFIIFSFLVLAIICYEWKRFPGHKGVSIPLGLIIGGLIGNLIDRLFFGFVTDFIDFRIWPVFNIADSAITIGVIWLVIYLWKRK